MVAPAATPTFEPKAVSKLDGWTLTDTHPFSSNHSQGFGPQSLGGRSICYIVKEGFWNLADAVRNLQFLKEIARRLFVRVALSPFFFAGPFHADSIELKLVSAQGQPNSSSSSDHFSERCCFLFTNRQAKLFVIASRTRIAAWSGAMSCRDCYERLTGLSRKDDRAGEACGRPRMGH